MADKFENLSIYDVDLKLMDDNGNEQVFSFKPLPFKTYPRVYDIIGKLTELKDVEGDDAFKSLDSKTMGELMDVQLEMVLNSNIGMDKRKAEIFVASNVFSLIEPLVSLTFKQEKANPRKMEQAKA